MAFAPSRAPLPNLVTMMHAHPEQVVPRPSGAGGLGRATLAALARKMALAGVIFALAGLAVFLAVRAVPGDPVGLRLKTPDPVRVAQERARLGLDRPVVVQWWMYQRGFLSGEWGTSFTTGRAVRDDFVEFFPATMELAVAALGLGLALGVATAVGAEAFLVGWLRRFSQLLGALGLTVPVFWIGLLALMVGSLLLGWFPSGGRFDLSLVPPPVRTGWMTVDAMLAGDPGALVDALRHLALPSLCLCLYPAAQISSVLRARLRDPKLVTLITSLRARGLGSFRIWLGHVARVTSAPVITAMGSNFGALLGGAVLTEMAFSWPGIGRYLVDAVINRDLYVVQNVLLFVLLLVIAVVFAADVLARLVNPTATGHGRQGGNGA